MDETALYTAIRQGNQDAVAHSLAGGMILATVSEIHRVQHHRLPNMDLRRRLMDFGYLPGSGRGPGGH